MEQLHNSKIIKNHISGKMPLIILTGPTAVGKTEISIRLAKAVNGEIISADSMQVYKFMDIGTAKILPKEMQGIKHYLIDVINPTEDFNVVMFQRMAKTAMEKIYSQGKIPIIAGGTGFYIQALLYDTIFEETEESNYRKELTQYYEQYGAHMLHEKLKEIDTISYEQIHENNVKRVIRALEFYHDAGYPISRHNIEQQHKKSPYNFVYFVLNDNRMRLYDKIEHRIDAMIRDGLVKEVANLLSMGCTKDMVSMQGLGYKEIIPYLNGECTLEEAVYILKRDTRHYAKRQLTWFRRQKDITWIDKPSFSSVEDMLQFMLLQLTYKQILICDND